MVSLSHLHQYLAAAVSSLLAFCSGCAYVWPSPLIVRLQQPGAEVFLTAVEVAWVVSLVELGDFLAPLPVAYLSDIFGRKIAMLCAAPLFLIAGILILTTRNKYILYIVRLLQGVGMGISAAVLPLYLGEVAEPNLRGTLSIFFTFFYFLGMMVTFIIGKLATYQHLAWFIIVTPAVYTLMFIHLPETPHFLLMKGKRNAAVKSLKWLRGVKDSAKVNQELAALTMEESQRHTSQSPWVELFQTKIGRISLSLGNIVVATQILGGFYAVFSYTADTLELKNIKQIDPDYLAVTFTATTIMISIVAAFLVDVMGRRPMLLVSGVLTFFSISLSATIFFLKEKTNIDISSIEWLLYFSLILFTSALNFAIGSLLPTLQAELFPTSTRSLASAIMGSVQSSLCFIVLRLYITIEYSVGVYVNFMFFSLCVMVGTCLIYLFFPETKGKTFQEIQEMLS